MLDYIGIMTEVTGCVVIFSGVCRVLTSLKSTTHIVTSVIIPI